MGLLNKFKAVAGTGMLISAFYTFQNGLSIIDSYIPPGQVFGYDFKDIARVAATGIEAYIGLSLLYDL